MNDLLMLLIQLLVGVAGGVFGAWIYRETHK